MVLIMFAPFTGRGVLDFKLLVEFCLNQRQSRCERLFYRQFGGIKQGRIIGLFHRRGTAPMKQADDAPLLDTSELSIEEAFAAALALVEAKLNQ